MSAALLFVALNLPIQPATPQPAAADDPIASLVGRRIRVTNRQAVVGPSSFAGTLAGYDGTVLAMSKGQERRTLPLEHVQTLQVSRGKRSVPLRALAVVAGAVVGFTAGGLASGGIEGDSSPIRFWGALAVGPLVGGYVGWHITGERWSTVRLADAHAADRRGLHRLRRETTAILDKAAP